MELASPIIGEIGCVLWSHGEKQFGDFQGQNSRWKVKLVQVWYRTEADASIL